MISGLVLIPAVAAEGPGKLWMGLVDAQRVHPVFAGHPVYLPGRGGGADAANGSMARRGKKDRHPTYPEAASSE